MTKLDVNYLGAPFCEITTRSTTDMGTMDNNYLGEPFWCRSALALGEDGRKKMAFRTDLKELIFNNTDTTNIGDAGGLRGSSTAGSFYIALFTSNPSDSSQGTETTYTDYARVAVARSVAGWAVSNGVAVNAADIVFPICGASEATITGFAICTGDTEGVDDAIYWGDLTDSLEVITGALPVFAAGSLSV